MEIFFEYERLLFVDAPGKYMNPIILQKLKGFGIYGNPDHNVNNDMSKCPIIFLDILGNNIYLFAPVFFARICKYV